MTLYHIFLGQASVFDKIRQISPLFHFYTSSSLFLGKSQEALDKE
jgi:hypothetical protein